VLLASKIRRLRFETGQGPERRFDHSHQRSNAYVFATGVVKIKNLNHLRPSRDEIGAPGSLRTPSQVMGRIRSLGKINLYRIRPARFSIKHWAMAVPPGWQKGVKTCEAMTFSPKVMQLQSPAHAAFRVPAVRHPGLDVPHPRQLLGGPQALESAPHTCQGLCLSVFADMGRAIRGPGQRLLTEVATRVWACTSKPLACLLTA